MTPAQQSQRVKGVPIKSYSPPFIPGVILLPQWAWRAEHQTKEDYSRTSQSHGMCLARFWTYLEPITTYFSPFLNGNVYHILSYHCILEAHNLFGFTDSQLERNFTLE